MKFSKRNRVTDGDNNFDDDHIVFAITSPAAPGIPASAQNCCPGLAERAKKKWLVFMVVGLVVVFLATGLGMIGFFRHASDGNPRNDSESSYLGNISETRQTLPETTASSTPDPFCSVANRTNCSLDDATSEEKCKANECCWKPGNNNIPWCFYPSSPLDPKCNIPESTRIDCHPDVGSSIDKCRARDCCWFPSSTNDKAIPYCFYPSDVKCNVPDDTRVDCHPDIGSNPDKCRARDCCWVPASIPDKGYPYCFYPSDVKCNVTDDTRVDCHPESGASPDKCRAKGCCWVPATSPKDGIPYCFYPADNSTG